MGAYSRVGAFDETKQSIKVNMNKAKTGTKFKASFETELMLLLLHAGLEKQCFWGCALISGWVLINFFRLSG